MKPLEAVIARTIWDVDLSALPAWRAWLTRVLRVVHAVVGEVLDGQLTLRAMSLVYTTLLSMVPLLAVSFSVLKGFGVHNQLEPLLLRVLAPLGERSAELTENVIGFVDNVKVGYLGGLGLALLIYTVVSLIQKIERAFNYAWHTAQTRSLGQRFSNYLSVIMVGPLLVFSAIGLTATLMSTAAVQWVASIEPFGTALNLVTQLVPYALVILAFAFVYGFVPNTRVRPHAALVGALVAGVAWESWGLFFASFVAGSARYTAIYSGFAVLIFFLIWLYVSWLILLLGASIAFYVQHPEHLTPRRRDLVLSARLEEKLALLVMARVVQEHARGGTPWTLERLARWLGLPADLIAGVVGPLEAAGLLLQTGAEPPGYVPAQSPEEVELKRVLDAVRSAGEGPALGDQRLPSEAGVDALLGSIDGAVAQSLASRTLKDLAARAG